MIKKAKVKFTETYIKSLKHPKTGDRYYVGDATNPYLFCRINPTTKVYYWQKTVNRKKMQHTIGNHLAITVKQARKIATDFTVKFASGRNPITEAAQTVDEPTLDTIFADYRVRSRGLEQGRDPSTNNDYYYKRFFKKWGHMQLSQITQPMARELIMSERDRGMVSQANRLQALGRGIWRHAMYEFEWDGKSPWMFKRVSEAGSRRKEIRLEVHHLHDFKKALDTLKFDYKVLFSIALYTGRRIGECRAMRWADFDFETAVWHIASSGVWVEARGKAKVGVKANIHGQDCLIPDVALDLLRRLKAIQIAETGLSPWVFPKDNKTGIIRNTQYPWNKVRGQGFEWLRINDLRGSSISLALSQGLPLSMVSQQAGHKTTETTTIHYGQIDFVALRKIVNANADLIKAAETEEPEADD